MEHVDLERLKWRCVRRALLEMDLLMGKFLEQEFPRLDDIEKKIFVELANLEDMILWPMINGSSDVDNPEWVPVINRIRQMALSGVT